MKKLLFGTLMVGALATSSMAILQIDVPATNFPAGHGPDSSVLFFLNTQTFQPFPTPWPATMIAGPDGFPLAYHLIFNYDGDPGLPIPAAVHHVDMVSGNCTVTWTPSPFQVLYQPGPNFPSNGVFPPFSEGCYPPPCFDPICEYGPTPLDFGVIINPQFGAPAPLTFTICNVGPAPSCTPLAGTVSENCDQIAVDVTGYSLNAGECVTVTVSYVGTGEGDFVCDILTGCGPVIVTGTVVVDANEAPAVFSLAEAYPNPFNPSTTIAYSVPEAQEVTLSVFNTNGQLVQTLVNGMVERGAHKVVFDASSLSSGVYVYTLQTANETAMKKMVLVK